MLWMIMRVRRVWRLLPAGVRRAAAPLLDPLRRPLMLRYVRWMMARTAPGGAPVIVVGFHDAILGIGEGARLSSAALRSAGVEVIDVDAARLIGSDPAPLDEAVPAGLPPGGTIITHLNPPELLALLNRLGPGLFLGRRHIGYWAWELPDLDPSWRPALPFVHEVWCPSAFTAHAVQAVARGRPVHVVPHPIYATPEPAADRARFGFADDDVIVFTALDLRSTEARKNATGAIAAMALAQAGARRPSRLVCKVVGAEDEKDAFARLQDLVAGQGRVDLITARLPRAEMDALIASVDIVLSLHRAEGFGLVLAEALRAGIAVVATGWSGNMEFMSADAACLVPHRLTAVVDPQGRYRNSVWAEPDVAAAGALLQGLIDDGDRRRAVGLAGRRFVEARLNLNRWTADVLGRLGLER